MGRARNIPFVFAVGFVFVTVAVTGCASSRNGAWFHKPKTSKEYLDMALEAPGADDRRKGITGLAASRDGHSDWAMKVYDTVARTDRDSMVRCAAIRAMLPAAGTGQVPTLINVLESSARKIPDCRAASGPVRWEAAKVLLAVVRDYKYQESERPQIVKTLLDRVARDSDRNVRLTVIETLAYFAEAPVPTALVDAMEEEDFAVQYAAEQSLIALTGETHDHDAKAWRKWLAETKDPFAKAGEIPKGASAKRSVWGEWPW
jgi:hypothetical protein